MACDGAGFVVRVAGHGAAGSVQPILIHSAGGPMPCWVGGLRGASLVDAELGVSMKRLAAKPLEVRSIEG